MPIAWLDEDEFSRALGHQLLALRKERRLTRKQLLELVDLDLSVQTIATYEHGTRRISAFNLAVVAAALGVSPAEIIEAVISQLSGGEHLVSVTIDLEAAAALQQPQLAPVRHWAVCLRRDIPNGPKTIRLGVAALEHLATLCGMDAPELIRHLPRTPGGSMGSLRAD